MTSSNDEKRLIFADKTRFVILGIGLCCIVCTNGTYNAVNFTVICMNDVIQDQTVENQTHWLENSSDVSLVFSSGAFGSVVALLASVPLISQYGIRNILSLYGLISAIATICIPFSVSIGFLPLLITRFIQGIGSSILFTSIGCISQGWSPNTEISTYVAFLSAGFQISNIITMPVAGLLCESFLGWRSIYYIFGSVAVIVYIAFFSFFRDNASLHRNVSKKELELINNGKSTVTGSRKTPYLEICKDKVIWAVWLAALGGNLSLVILITYGPTYLNKVLELDIRETGFSNAFPYILAAIVKFIAGPLSDNMTIISEKWRMIFFAAISQGGMAIAYLVMAITRVKIIAQIAYTSCIVLAGINIVGIVKCAQMVARQHVHFVMAVISLNVWLNLFLLPILIGLVCPDNSPEQWGFFFICIAIWIIVMNIPFPFLASIEPAEYTKPGWKKNNKIQPIDVKI